MIGPSDIRTVFPEFVNTTLYPDAQFQYWINDGYANFNAVRFDTQLDLAVMLYACHSVVLSAREQATAANTGIPGQVQGPVTAKSVDKVSISYSTDTSMDIATTWNFTTYGQRLYKLMRTRGAGPVYAPSWKARARLPW